MVLKFFAKAEILNHFLGGSYEKDSDAMGGGIAACAISLFFAACVNSEYDGRIDTVYSLATPSVSAKAYPGVNIVSWNPVSGVEYYKVYIYEEGVLKGEDTVSEGYRYSHTDLMNGKNYKYCVEAVGRDGLPAREVYVTNSGRGEASARAIVPPADTKSLELPAYEDGYDGMNNKYVSSNDQWIVNSDNISVSVVDGKVYVNFPMKAYLEYTVKYYDNDISYQVDSGIDVLQRSLSCCDNNTLGEISFDITGAGKYKVAVEARALNSKYITSDAILYTNLIEIEALNVNVPVVNANYIGSSEACIEFTPATKENGEPVPIDWYKIYRRKYGEYDSTLLGNTIRMKGSLDNDRVTYYVNDSLSDTTCTYVYTVVVTDKTKYSASNPATLSSNSSRTLSIDGLYDISAYYSSSGVYVEFGSARMMSGENVPNNWYMIFRHDLVENSYVQLSAIPEEYSYNTLRVYDSVPDNSHVYEYVIVVTDGILRSTQKLSNKVFPYFNEGNDIDIECVYDDSEKIVKCIVTCKSEAAKIANIVVKYIDRDYYFTPEEQDFKNIGIPILPSEETVEINGDKKFIYPTTNISDEYEKYVFFCITAEESSFTDYCHIPAATQQE
ncbi:MAG: hypothetical protein K2N58_04350 [Treponemataceae bacterium]|nr:hypothetical protein [Treponemataceae bacterium]